MENFIGPIFAPFWAQFCPKLPENRVLGYFLKIDMVKCSDFLCDIKKEVFLKVDDVIG